MAEEAKTCDHPGCTCVAGDDSDYCSPFCETAAGSTELSCNCGHTGCASELTHQVTV